MHLDEYLSFSEKSLDFLRFFLFLKIFLFDSRISLEKEISLKMEALGSANSFCPEHARSQVWAQEAQALFARARLCLPYNREL
jgi:hypothetical protein